MPFVTHQDVLCTKVKKEDFGVVGRHQMMMVWFTRRVGWYHNNTYAFLVYGMKKKKRQLTTDELKVKHFTRMSAYWEQSIKKSLLNNIDDLIIMQT